MVAISAVVWLCTAFAGSTIVFQHFVRPRLPVYRLHVESFPRLRWIAEQGMWKTQLPTRVSLFNENYLPIDVHALQFDLFYASTWDGSLQYLGHVQDRHQQKLKTATAVSPSCLASTTIANSRNSTANASAQRQQPVWQIGPRADFDCQDKIYVGIPVLAKLLPSLASMIKHWIKGRGRLILPTTGVAHVQVPPAAKATIALICDNSVNLWTLQVVGVVCELKQVVPGFTSLERMADTMRQHALEHLRPHAATGGLFLEQHYTDDLEKPQEESSHWWKDIVRSLQEGSEHAKTM